jgi:hypothetical protein
MSYAGRPPYTITGKDRYACATRRSKGTCSNALVINRQHLETRILGGLKERLMAPELVKAFFDEFNAEIRRSAQNSESDRIGLKHSLSDIDRKIAGIMKAIKDGNYNPTLTKRLNALETDKLKAEADVANPQRRPSSASKGRRSRRVRSTRRLERSRRCSAGSAIRAIWTIIRTGLIQQPT